MKRVLLGGLGAAVLTIGLGAAPATAAEDRPECEIDAWSDGQDADGDVVAVIPVFSVAQPGANPVSATVTCAVKVDGAIVDSVTNSGSGVVVVQGAVDFPHSANGFSVCTTIDYTSTTEPTDTWCTGYTWMGSWEEEVDSYLCPVLDDVPDAGPVDVTDEGDVYVAGEFIWDCPPYEG